MDLNSTRMFANVVTKGSFSAAASFMAVPVATVSRRVADLESALGVRLLERTTRKLRLTEAGAILYEFASRGLEEMEAGLLALSEQQQNLQGRLRLSLPPSFEPMWKLLGSFQELYTNIEIDLFVTERRLDFIEDGIDVAVRIGDLASLSAIARLLLSYRHRVVASPEFLAGNLFKTPLDVATCKCAAWAKKEQDIVWFLGNEKVSIKPFIRANDYAYMRYLALNHKCITELPPFYCQEHIEKGALVEVLPEYPMPDQQVSLVYPSRKHVSRITRVFIDYCVKNFKVAVLLSS
ncbi:Transcriptional regulator, LysR family [hydrothermal vent metagenome]|uniref:Transcriptional regulator, LysR family n=1 Tax=hydrothermal vent metagenome TaxID=652676 RepID=A0A3B0YYR3_9ZZZZ